MNPNVKARFELLKVGYKCHQNKLNDHDARLKELEPKLAKQDNIVEKSNKILEALRTHTL